jgi:hypothetical protein
MQAPVAACWSQFEHALELEDEQGPPAVLGHWTSRQSSKTVNRPCATAVAFA